MTREEAKSCIGTIETLQRLAYNIHGVMDVIDADNCKKIIKALEQEPTKNDLGIDAISRADARSLICNTDIKHHMSGMSRKVFKDLYNGMDELPSVTPQEPRKDYLSIDDVMSVFDDFMCGEVDEEGTETFLEMLKDKAESEDKE